MSHPILILKDHDYFKDPIGYFENGKVKFFDYVDKETIFSIFGNVCFISINQEENKYKKIEILSWNLSYVELLKNKMNKKGETKMFKLGEQVKDKIRGFTGTIVGKCEYLTGCVQYSVTPKQKKGEVAYPKGVWLDEDRLELISKKKSLKLRKKINGGMSHNQPSTK